MNDPIDHGARVALEFHVHDWGDLDSIPREAMRKGGSRLCYRNVTIPFYDAMNLSDQSNLRSPVVIGRLAPSPTGGLHLGHARTFLLAWLSARAAGGRVLLRIEDLDATRSRPEAVAGARADLAWLGLDHDGDPVVQSSRGPAYQTALDILKRAERVYPCTCSRADLARAVAAPHADEEGPIYPGTCSHRRSVDADSLGDRPYAWRFRVPEGDVQWLDLLKGVTAIDPGRTSGDFIVARSHDVFAYQLAVVVDDAAMGVNEVIRGDDLVPSTPRQLLLYNALGMNPPRFGHIPLVLDDDGRRLAKRDGAIKLATLRERGVDPRFLIGLLAQSLGQIEPARPCVPSDLIATFRLDQVPRQPWRMPSI